jgi:hypothetical protein
MRLRRYFSFIIIIFLSFTSCQKQDLFGDVDYNTLGQSAHDLLSADVYTSLLVEINYMPGRQPSAASILYLQNFIESICNKPAGIRIITRPIGTTGKTSLTIEEITALEKTHRSAYAGSTQMGVSILLTDGYFSGDDLFAVSYWNTSFCVFGKLLDDYSGRTGQVSKDQLLSTVLAHEFCHLLGLVDQGSPMQSPHRDNDNGAHCTNSSCLMYYIIENRVPPALSIPGLDANCRNDLKANGGK